MDRTKALDILDRLKGRDISGWQISKFLDNGKSAAVFKASRGDEVSAIKVFDTDLITKFGGDALTVRSERERSLLSHQNPHLVKMLDAGVDQGTGLHYLAMEFLPGRSMADCIEDIPYEKVALLTEQIASAAYFLEGKSLAHRDIKPANIMVSPDYSHATLLDLGVLKPVGEAGLTDNGDHMLFIGTNQYASPEFALRHELDSIEGWRALTFYQLGAVLHDMIMRKPLYADHVGVPARLAQAVQTEVVQIRSPEVAPWLITLAQNCLVKSPTTRLRLVSWESFIRKVPKKDMALELRERIRQRASAATTVDEELKRYQISPTDEDHSLQRLTIQLMQETMRTVGRGDPQLGRRIVYEIDDGAAIRCDFEPSSRIGIPSGLSVCLRATTTDATSRIVEISASAHSEKGVADWAPSEWQVIFEGLLDEGSVEESVGLYVLASVDEAQAASINVEAR